MRVSAKQLAQTLYDLTDGKSKPEIEKSVADFAAFIRSNRKLKILEKIIEQFAKIYNRQNGIIDAEIVTAEKLSGATEKKLEEYIEKKYHAKKVVLKNTIDEKIKGGIMIKVGDEIMDGSVRGRLLELKKVLVK